MLARIQQLLTQNEHLGERELSSLIQQILSAAGIVLRAGVHSEDLRLWFRAPQTRSCWGLGDR